jgi:hypothetical protein
MECAGGVSALLEKILITARSGRKLRGPRSRITWRPFCCRASWMRAGIVRRGLPEFADTAWRKRRWKTRYGMRRRGRNNNLYGSCWEEHGARLLAAYQSAFRTRRNNFCEKIETELEAGYRRIKIKVKPGWDLNVLEKIRARWADIVLSVDANSAYTLDEVEHLRKFDAFNLLMIEQPLWNDEIYLHARLQKSIETAICLDESILNARDADFALETGACRIINIKVGRVGGFSEAKKIHDVTVRHNVPVWCGGMLESGVGRAQYRVVDARKFPLAGRCVGIEALLERGHHRARSGSPRRWNDCHQ